MKYVYTYKLIQKIVFQDIYKPSENVIALVMK